MEVFNVAGGYPSTAENARACGAIGVKDARLPSRNPMFPFIEDHVDAVGLR